MKIIAYALVSYTTITRYEIAYERPIENLTPEMVKKIVEDAELEGQAFIIIAGIRMCYAVKHDNKFHIKYLT